MMMTEIIIISSYLSVLFMQTIDVVCSPISQSISITLSDHNATVSKNIIDVP